MLSCLWPFIMGKTTFCVVKSKLPVVDSMLSVKLCGENGNNQTAYK
jgi:hypothetical protein